MTAIEEILIALGYELEQQRIDVFEMLWSDGEVDHRLTQKQLRKIAGLVGASTAGKSEAAPEQTEGEVSADPIDAIDATANYKLVHRVKAMLAESHNIPKETDFARGYREALIQLINGEDLPEPAESAPEPQLEGLSLYYQIQHVLGECNADGHLCSYDADISEVERRNQARELLAAAKQNGFQAGRADMGIELWDATRLDGGQVKRLSGVEVYDALTKAINDHTAGRAE